MSFRNVFMSMSLIAFPVDVDEPLLLFDEFEVLTGGSMAMAYLFLPLPCREGRGEGSILFLSASVSNNQIQSCITNSLHTRNSLRRRHSADLRLRLCRPPRQRLVCLLLR